MVAHRQKLRAPGGLAHNEHFAAHCVEVKISRVIELAQKFLWPEIVYKDFLQSVLAKGRRLTQARCLRHMV